MAEAVIDIDENLPTEDEPLGVCVCPVPKFFRLAKPEAFIPQFVGLGPYHHSNTMLIMTDELKLGVAERIFKVNDLLTNNRDQNFISDVEALYHSDVGSTYDSHTLLYLLTVDGLFLLALLHHANLDLEQQFSSCYILTGRKRGMPLVNAAGVELTMDGIMRDVFMLENQIPTQILKNISRVNNIKGKEEIQSCDDTHLGLTMLKFCEAHCPLVHSTKFSNNLEGYNHLLDLNGEDYAALSPLVHSEKLSKYPESHDHLLDLMYHMIALMPEMESPPQPKLPWMFRGLLFFVSYIILLIYHLLGLLMVTTVQGTQAVLLKVPLLGAILPQLKMEIPSWTDYWGSVWAKNYAPVIFLPFIPTPNYIVQLIGEDSTKSSDEPVTIPSATELHKAEIRFKPAKGAISSIGFNGIKKEFYLPCMKLDVMSEVIIRNLVAYESLIKSDCLIFGRYIELMSSLIHTAEDVKLLIDNEIIQTQLSADFVAQLFKGMPMTKLIRRPTNPYIRNFELLLMTIKVKFDAFHTLKLFQNQFRLASTIFGVIFVFSPVLIEVVKQLWSSTIFASLYNFIHNFIYFYCLRNGCFTDFM